MYARARELVGEAVPDPFLTNPPFFRFFKIYFDKINIADNILTVRQKTNELHG